MTRLKPPPNLNGKRTDTAFWTRLVRQTAKLTPTPFYLFSTEPIPAALDALQPLATLAGRSIRHWFSCKTQPFPPLLSWWHQQGGSIEVVSEFEFLAALQTGFPASNILVNGPAKHSWLQRHPISHLNVNFDSLTELDALLPIARRQNWRTGLRLLTRAEFHPEFPDQPTPFGLEPTAARRALRTLRQHGLEPHIAHFHLRTNLPTAQPFADALQDIVAFCRAHRWSPRILDCGGGFPPPFTRHLDGQPVHADFSLLQLGHALANAARLLPGLEEFWFENGRHLLARTGALVTKVLDVKHRRGLRQLICDGGRTLHALVSTWENHDLLLLPRRQGRRVLTAVHGPTCMAFDRLALLPLPASTQPGDLVAWLDAGAYHLSWETRFSHGHAAVLWHHQDQIQLVRPAQTFRNWWTSMHSV